MNPHDIVIRKKKKYKMDQVAAGDALQNIFAACNQKPNNTPFDEIIRTSRPDNRAANFGIWACSILLVVTLICPLTFSQTELKDNYVIGDCLYLDCSGQKLIPEECTMVDANGVVYTYQSYNRDTNTICFQKPESDANITLVFKSNKEIHLGYSIK